MSDLLTCLVSSIPAAHDAVRKISEYVSRIDARLLPETAAQLDRTPLRTATSPNGAEPNHLLNESNILDYASWPDIMSIGFDQQYAETPPIKAMQILIILGYSTSEYLSTGFSELLYAKCSIRRQL